MTTLSDVLQIPEVALTHQPHQPEVTLTHQLEVPLVPGVALAPQVPLVTQIPLAPKEVKHVAYEKMEAMMRQ